MLQYYADLLARRAEPVASHWRRGVRPAPAAAAAVVEPTEPTAEDLEEAVDELDPSENDLEPPEGELDVAEVKA